MGLTGAVWTVILIGGTATFGLRASFLLAAGRLATTPEWLRTVFRMIPPAALAALAAPAVLRPDGDWTLLSPRPLAAVVALAVAWATRSIAWTMAVGLAAVIGLEWLW